MTLSDCITDLAAGDGVVAPVAADAALAEGADRVKRTGALTRVGMTAATRQLTRTAFCRHEDGRSAQVRSAQMAAPRG